MRGEGGWQGDPGLDAFGSSRGQADWALGQCKKASRALCMFFFHTHPEMRPRWLVGGEARWGIGGPCSSASSNCRPLPPRPNKSVAATGRGGVCRAGKTRGGSSCGLCGPLGSSRPGLDSPWPIPLLMLLADEDRPPVARHGSSTSPDGIPSRLRRWPGLGGVAIHWRAYGAAAIWATHDRSKLRTTGRAGQPFRPLRLFEVGRPVGSGQQEPKLEEGVRAPTRFGQPDRTTT